MIDWYDISTWEWNEFDSIDENRLSSDERLALAACRLMGGKWDDYLGQKPDGFDEYPYQFTRPVQAAIERSIGGAIIDKMLWTIHHGATEEEWRHHYYVTRAIEDYSRDEQWRKYIETELRKIRGEQIPRRGFIRRLVRKRSSKDTT